MAVGGPPLSSLGTQHRGNEGERERVTLGKGPSPIHERGVGRPRAKFGRSRNGFWRWGEPRFLPLPLLRPLRYIRQLGGDASQQDREQREGLGAKIGLLVMGQKKSSNEGRGGYEKKNIGPRLVVHPKEKLSSRVPPHQRAAKKKHLSYFRKRSLTLPLRRRDRGCRKKKFCCFVLPIKFPASPS